MKTTKKQPEIKLSDELRALDLKQRDFRNQLAEHLQKKFSPYLMMRYAASVEGELDLQAYYLLAANENANKHFFDLQKHPELQWLCCTAVSPGLGQQRHYWLGSEKKTPLKKQQDSLKKTLMELLPNKKVKDIDLLIEINTVEDLEEWIKQHGK